MNGNFIIDALLGVSVGDAIGVPVEFKSRASLALDPVVGVRSLGTHGQPAGTWSDDSALTFCLAEMLCGPYDLHDLARRFINTTGAIVGGLAGLAYGWHSIPSEWLACLARKKDIEDLGERLSDNIVER